MLAPHPEDRSCATYLVHADNFTSRAPSMEYAMRPAASFDARISGVHVCPSPLAAIAPYDGSQLVSAVVEEIRELKAEAYPGRNAFVTRAKELSATHFETIATSCLGDLSQDSRVQTNVRSMHPRCRQNS